MRWGDPSRRRWRPTGWRSCASDWSLGFHKSCAPDYIIAGHTKGGAVEAPIFLSDVELSELPEFRECFRQRQEFVPYSDAMARLGPPRLIPRPMVFIYYQRTCPKPAAGPGS